MNIPFVNPKSVTPVSVAEDEIDRLDRQRAKLADRLSRAVVEVEGAVRARHDALVAGDIADKDLAKLNQASAAAAESRAAIEAAMRTIVEQIEEATRRRDELRDAAERQRIAEDEERRAAALDAAADGLAAAAVAFSKARTALVAAVGEHGIRVDNALTVEGVPVHMLAGPAINAAVRKAAPGALPVMDGFGTLYDTDCALVVRRGISGTLRDHAEDLLSGKVPAVEMPRPHQGPAIDVSNPLTTTVPMVRGIARKPLCYIHPVTNRMIHVGPGEADMPPRVLEVAIEADLAVPADDPHRGTTLREVNKPPAPSYLKTPNRPAEPVAHFIDTENGEVITPSVSDRLPAIDSADKRSGALRSYYVGRSP